MAKEPMLQNLVSTQLPANEYGYPDLASVIVFGAKHAGAGQAIHLIFGSGDASDAPGALYANAPNGSIYIPLTATAGNFKIYVKFGAKGGISGTWVATAALT